MVDWRNNGNVAYFFTHYIIHGEQACMAIKPSCAIYGSYEKDLADAGYSYKRYVKVKSYCVLSKIHATFQHFYNLNLPLVHHCHKNDNVCSHESPVVGISFLEGEH